MFFSPRSKEIHLRFYGINLGMGGACSQSSCQKKENVECDVLLVWNGVAVR